MTVCVQISCMIAFDPKVFLYQTYLIQLQKEIIEIVSTFYKG